jgi:hypothetical protein
MERATVTDGSADYPRIALAQRKAIGRLGYPSPEQPQELRQVRGRRPLLVERSSSVGFGRGAGGRCLLRF